MSSGITNLAPTRPNHKQSPPEPLIRNLHRIQGEDRKVMKAAIKDCQEELEPHVYLVQRAKQNYQVARMTRDLLGSNISNMPSNGSQHVTSATESLKANQEVAKKFEKDLFEHGLVLEKKVGEYLKLLRTLKTMVAKMSEHAEDIDKQTAELVGVMVEYEGFQKSVVKWVGKVKDEPSPTTPVARATTWGINQRDEDSQLNGLVSRVKTW
ncbi:hypothetical protein T439DRAFT_97481 [Meredithblackwellia eburnea MCA 4105]